MERHGRMVNQGNMGVPPRFVESFQWRWPAHWCVFLCLVQAQSRWKVGLELG